MKLFTGCDEGVAAWVARELGIRDFGPSSAFGVADESGKIVGGIVFHNYQPQYRSVEVSIAMLTPRWANPGIIRRTLSYAFDTLNVRRITATTPRKAASARRFLTKLGFRYEGMAWKGFGTDDAVISGLRDYEWRASKWGPLNGQVNPAGARSNASRAGANAIQ